MPGWSSPCWTFPTRVPTQWERVKSAVEELRGSVEPDLIIGPALHDAHHDRRVLAEMVPNVFRNHLVLGYEILKWDSDLTQPNAYLPIAEPVLREKIDKLHEHYGSQLDRSWFDSESFAGAGQDPRRAVPGPVRGGVPRGQGGARSRKTLRRDRSVKRG